MSPQRFDEDPSSTTVHQQRFDFSDVADSAFWFTVVQGPDQGRAFALEAPALPRALIGTGPACEFRLADRTVSRRHAELEVYGSHARIADVGSTNGTWVNGVSIVEARLSGGEQIKIGDDVFLVQRSALAAKEALPTAMMMNLRIECDRLLIAARDRAISFVTAYQSPSWVTPQASRQASWIAVSYTQDDDVVSRLAEVMGRSKAEVRGAFKGLDPFAWVIVGRNPREPYRVTIPDPR